MNNAWILGIYSTRIGRQTDADYRSLAREALLGAMSDAKLNELTRLDGIWFGSLLMDYWDQLYCRGQVCLTPLVNDGTIPHGTPITNVESGCATGSLAFNGAVTSVMAGKSELALAIGVEKMYDPDRPGALFKHLENSGDNLDPEAWQSLYKESAASMGYTFELGGGRSIAMDIYALWAKTHMERYGTQIEHLAAAAAKNHSNSVSNTKAQYRFPMTTDEVMSDRPVVYPLTRAMCAPVGDGAAAAIVCSEKYLKSCPPDVRARAVPILASELASSGTYDATWEDKRTPVLAAQKAYAAAVLTPKDIDLVELHDATSFAEIHLIEDLGLCGRGEGGFYTASGATEIGGEVAVNPSGGLVSRGHPIGATGIIMLNELCVQLRGEAAENQVKNARYGLSENSGGITGNDLALASVTILGAPSQ